MTLIERSKYLLPVMIVDDDAEIIKSVSRDLRRVAEIECFQDPVEALKKFREKDYSVIISDLKMPHMNGLELLAECALSKPEVQRILLTAFIDLADLETSINKAQLNLLLTKPWEPSQLQRAVEEAQRRNELIRENIELRRISLTDELTGIANHRYFRERIVGEFSRAKRYGRPLSLIMLDIDNFKRFNDEYGHQKGDEILRSVAQTLAGELRGMDTVARYGGEEFSIILPETTRPLAVEIAKRHLDSVIKSTQIQLSAGVAAYPDDASSPEELIHKADQALLAAKAQGKARVISALELK